MAGTWGRRRSCRRNLRPLGLAQDRRPQDVPEPWIRPSALERIARVDHALAGAAKAERLDVDVRALGSAFRAYGRADTQGLDKEVVAARRAVAEAAQRALSGGEAPVLKLRAFQLESFLREVARWEATGKETDELHELGGPFVLHARRVGWIREGSVLCDDAVRRALFKKRYNELGMLRGTAQDRPAP